MTGPSAPLAIEFVVHGDVAGQGSKRHVGNGRMIEQSKKVGPWRLDIRAAARSATHALGDLWRPLDGALAVDVLFVWPARKTRPPVAARLWEAWKWTTPDIDKCLRSTFDALKGVVWIDDAQVAEVTARKAYPTAERPGLVSGAVIRVWQLGARTDGPGQ